MQCSRPFVIRRRDGRREQVPCGECVCCRIARAREWATRCVHEASLWKSSGFITLTYCDQDLPTDASLDKAEFTRFWKRLRKELDPDRIRYYGCGEYGELNGRPHYHAIVFGIAPCSCPDSQSPVEECGCEDRELVMRCWGHGGVGRIGTVTYKSARYCADYIGKADSSKVVGKREREFHVMSKGIGRGYIELNEDRLRVDRGVTIMGNHVGLPRYYANKLGIEKEVMSSEYRVSKMKSKIRVVWGGGPVPKVLEDAMPEARQREANAVGRLELFKKEL